MTKRGTFVVVVLAMMIVVTGCATPKKKAPRLSPTVKPSSLLVSYSKERAGSTLQADEGFSIDFPIAPTRTTSSLGSGTSALPVVNYAAVAAPETYSVQFVDYSGRTGNAKNILDATVVAVAKQTKGTVVRSVASTTANGPAVTYVVRSPTGWVHGKALFFGPHFVQLYVTSPGGTSVGYSRFVRSFAVTPT